MKKQELSNILERKDLIFSNVDKIHWLIEIKKKENFQFSFPNNKKKLKIESIHHPFTFERKKDVLINLFFFKFL